MINAMIAPNKLVYAKLRVEDFLFLNGSGASDGYSKTGLLDGKI
jgi:hypothetical protein